MNFPYTCTEFWYRCTKFLYTRTEFPYRCTKIPQDLRNKNPARKCFWGNEHIRQEIELKVVFVRFNALNVRELPPPHTYRKRRHRGRCRAIV
ncbi:MAG: hypothetical protein LBR75_05725 [Prevotellaceae bacterium]|nr:hypothetical protein [Prevotellaceae bacterium]